MACLIGEDALSYVICLGEDVLMFLAMEWCAVGGFKWDWFGFGRLCIFLCLVHVVFISFVRLRVVLLDFRLSEERSSSEGPCFDGLDLCGLHWVATNGMHPFDCLLCGLEVIDTVCLLEGFCDACFWLPWLPMPLLLHKWYVVASLLVPDSNEDGLP